VAIFIWSKRFTGGSDLRGRIRKDLRQGEVEDRVFNLRHVVVFPEAEDEGPILFFRDGPKVYVLSGQRMTRLAKDGLPRENVVVSIAPISERIVGLKSGGAKTDALVSNVPFSKSTFFDKKVFSKPLTEVAVDWDKLVASVQAV
jgi:hypothetical protein